MNTQIVDRKAFRYKRVSKFSAFMFAMFVVVFAGCGDDDDIISQWVGTWTVESVNGKLASEDRNFTSNEFEFQGDGTWIWEIGYKDTSNPEIYFTIIASGTYSISDSHYSLVFGQMDFDLPPQLRESGLNEQELGQTATALFREEASGNDGSWVRKGDRLTLTSSPTPSGQRIIAVFRKK